MKTVLPLPVLATVKAAYHDVLGDIKGFACISWLILLMMMVFVEVPTLFVSNMITKAMRSDETKNIQAMIEKSEAPASVQEEQKIQLEKARRVPSEYLMIIMGLNVLEAVFLFSFSVAWYRQLLLGEDKGKTITFRYAKPEWEFTVTAMKCGFSMLPFMLVMMSYGIAMIPALSEDAPISVAEAVPVLLICAVLAVALMARLSMAYPLTIMGRHDAPVKESWILTRQQTGRIVVGSMMVIVPVFLLALFVVGGVSYILNLGAVDATLTLDDPLTFIEHMLYKLLGAVFMLCVFGLVTAFLARSYAFLVRSQES